MICRTGTQYSRRGRAWSLVFTSCFGPPPVWGFVGDSSESESDSGDSGQVESQEEWQEESYSSDSSDTVSEGGVVEAIVINSVQAKVEEKQVDSKCHNEE